MIERIDRLEELGNRYIALLPKRITTDRLNRRRLLDAQINRRFNLQELGDLYFATGVDWDNASGGKVDRVRYLITHHLNHNTMRHLMVVLKQDRPEVEWPQLDDE